MNTYAVGTTVRLWGTFKAASYTVTSGVPTATYALTDPSTVTLQVENPAGTVTSYTYAAATVSKNSTGVFYKDVALDTAGDWSYRWVGTGAVAVTGEEFINVQVTQTA